MYGTVARWRVKAGNETEFEQLVNDVTNEIPTGSRGVFLYRADTDPLEYWVASQWDSKEAYTSNSNTPEQDERFRRLRALMDGDPEWHDGEIVVART
jgi:heme-degrading monooxygenase HmoA